MRLLRSCGGYVVMMVATMLHSGVVFADDAAAQRWLERFSHKPPLVESGGVCAGPIGALPAFEVTPQMTRPQQLVRVSLPFAPGALPQGLGLKAHCDGHDVTPDLRALTLHPGKPASVRRGMITFPFQFTDIRPHHFTLSLADVAAADSSAPITSPLPVDAAYRVSLVQQEYLERRGSGGFRAGTAGVTVAITPEDVAMTLADGTTWSARLLAPARAQALPSFAEQIEAGAHYLWVRLLAPDAEWPRIIEVRIDSLGTVAVQAHVQRLGAGDATAPDLGWEIHGPAKTDEPKYLFTNGAFCTLTSRSGAHEINFPVAPYNRRGSVVIAPADRGPTIRYLRCAAEEKVPMQEAAWRRAEFVLGDAGRTRHNALLEPIVATRADAAAFDAIYGSNSADALALWPVLDDLRRYTREAIKKCQLVGDDFGNVTAFTPDAPASVFGMNRLNHGPEMFREAWRSGDTELRDVAVEWCSNMYDLSLWWGDKEDFGGTRYNNAVAAGEKAHQDDKAFMWRTNWASHFCTKGFDAFFYAYEETGDPRMSAALRAQVEYARAHVFTNKGECRNIGDVADFMNLYRCTGAPMYRDEALRLFRELRTKLSPRDLFSQGGQPIVEDGPFIDDDAHGYEAPFAKPYIIGYALAGLPALLDEFPDEPKLRDVVRAVADFLAESEDPIGGWRYPHPRSSGVLVSQGLEHAGQLTRAAAVLERRGEDIRNLLDAIERVLQARVKGFERTGMILAGLSGWEKIAGAIGEGKTIYDLYQKATDRDPARDYSEGAVAVGGAPPDGLVYFGEVLQFYLAHRPAERLFHANDALQKVLARTEDRRIRLIPQPAGSFLRMERPENSAVGFTLWGPEWVTFPNLGYSAEELGGMTLDWKRDEESGTVWYTIDRPEATFTAAFTPRADYVECAYTTWPKPGTETPTSLGVGPCQQMKPGIFDGEEADLLNRLRFLSDGQWVSVGSCANNNPRNVIYLKGKDSPEITGAMAESGWKTIQSSRPDNALIACVSRDGVWAGATAAEYSNSICNNAAASHRCIHSQGGMALRKDGPTTLRVNAYLLRGSLEELRIRYQHDVQRWKSTPSTPSLGEARSEDYGLRAGLPSLHEARISRMDFPLAWRPDGPPFAEWRAKARQAFLDTLSVRPPQAPFAVHVAAAEDRGSYDARKLTLNISADNRIGAYLLVPKGKGPFPAMLALHDHGAHFSIGKEKVVRPFGVSAERLADAQAWVNDCYGGKWIGDELAQRGYVVFAMDALFWGDRGRKEGVKYESQEQLAANMLQLGLSWAGTIVWDDIRGAEFLHGLPEVDPDRIGCLGLSMGSNRAWHLAAATDIIKAGAAICWLGDTPTLMAEGNNQTKGQSAFSMIHPGLRNLLDYPDVAAIACPKPMLFFNGEQDGLFPVQGVQAAYERMRRVWDSQNADDDLVTKLWLVPHVFNADMQKEAFDWLDRRLKE